MGSAPQIDVYGHPVVSESETPEVHPGRMYRHTGAAGRIVRIAKVFDVRPDAMGIPHVHFELRVGCDFDRQPVPRSRRSLARKTTRQLARRLAERTRLGDRPRLALAGAHPSAQHAGRDRLGKERRR